MRKEERLLNALNDIDDALIAEAGEKPFELQEELTVSG